MLRKATKTYILPQMPELKFGGIRSTRQGGFTVRDVGTELEGKVEDLHQSAPYLVNRLQLQPV